MGELVAVDNVDNLTIITEINGCEADHWNTAGLQRNAAELLSALSEFATLNPGDAILLGTPQGRVEIRPGDRVRILAEGFHWKTRWWMNATWRWLRARTLTPRCSPSA